jgi:fatty-acyl-CoA synthase
MFINELAELKKMKIDLSSLRTGIMAGSICPEQVMRNVMEKMHMTDVTIA